MNLSQSEEIELCKLLELESIDNAQSYLVDFTQWTFSSYEVSEHHRRYSEALDKFASGKIKNLMVFMPPQHGKSELCSRRLPSKLLGDNPNLRIALVSYNHSFASKFNRDIQRIIDSEDYRKVYPNTILAGKSAKGAVGTWLRNSEEFEVVGYKGSFISVGVGGGLTGSTAQPSQTVLIGIEGAIARITGVTRYKVYENDTSQADSNGLPPRSITCVVEGGSDQDIANSIYLKKTPGCYTNGTTAIQVTDSNGNLIYNALNQPGNN